MGSSVGITRVEDLDRARRGGRDGAAPRPAGDRRGLRPRARGRVLGARQRGDARPRCRGRSSPTPSGTTTRRSTPRAAWTWRSRRRSRRATARVRELAAEVFRLAGCSGLARCDFFVEPDGTVLVNEINTMPGFTETSVYAKLWRPTACPTRTSATASSPWRSSATPAPAPTSSNYEPKRTQPFSRRPRAAASRCSAGASRAALRSRSRISLAVMSGEACSTRPSSTYRVWRSSGREPRSHPAVPGGRGSIASLAAPLARRQALRDQRRLEQLDVAVDRGPSSSPSARCGRRCRPAPSSAKARLHFSASRPLPRTARTAGSSPSRCASRLSIRCISRACSARRWLGSSFHAPPDRR